MNRCKVCNTECNGNTCSGACRAKLSRRTRRSDNEAHAPAVTEAHAQADKLVPGNANRYIRPDGTQYQLDCLGKAFEVNSDGLVYATVEEVRACYV